MRQVAHEAAPFATIDEALDVGLEYLRALVGCSPVGMVAVEQAGGYFVRVSWTRSLAGGRKGRHRREQLTAEIGRAPINAE